MRQSESTTIKNDTCPVWPIVVFDRDVCAYDKDWWYGDADLCDAGIWSDQAEVIDSQGRVFYIENRLLKSGRWLGLIPWETRTNLFVSVERSESIDSLLDRLKLRTDVPETIIAECEQAAGIGGANQAIERVVLKLYQYA